MRKPEYISPSALQKYQSSPEDYYLNYLSDWKPERTSQTPAMAAGSAFDAYIKSYLHDRIYGKGHVEADKYALRSIFESQVDSELRDTAWAVGARLFAAYKDSGALADLMLELKDSVDAPRFEFSVSGVVNGVREGVSREVGTRYNVGVPLLGKPDLRFVNSKGAAVIYDFKVNGYYGKGNTSPTAGYVECREESKGTVTSSWNRKGPHRDAIVVEDRGIHLNVAGTLDQWAEDWAAQLSIYGWLLGESVGAEVIIGVDQIVANNLKGTLRIASHRSKVASEFQFSLFDQLQELWNLINETPFWFFRDISYEDSVSKCHMLDQKSKLYFDPNLSSEERWALGLSKETPYRGK